jgi:hypothetical protein
MGVPGTKVSGYGGHRWLLRPDPRRVATPMSRRRLRGAERAFSALWWGDGSSPDSSSATLERLTPTIGADHLVGSKKRRGYTPKCKVVLMSSGRRTYASDQRWMDTRRFTSWASHPGSALARVSAASS